MSKAKHIEGIMSGNITLAKPSKEEKFVQLAQKRVARAMVAIRAIGRLASPNYRYTQGQSDKIVHTLQGELDAVYSKFNEVSGETKVTFTL